MGQKVRTIVLLLGLALFLHGFVPAGRVTVSVGGTNNIHLSGMGLHQPGIMTGGSAIMFIPEGDKGLHLPVREKIEWLSLEEAQARQSARRKPILIDLYTNWCGWCKVMDKKTYARPEVARYITENFYPVKIDAESRELMTWQGRQFTYNVNARIHNLAIFLTRGQLSFPQTIFIMPADAEPQAIPGYLEVKDMELLLKYFGEGHYGKRAFSDFQKNFSPSWK